MSRARLSGLVIGVVVTAYSIVMLTWIVTGALEPANRLLGGGC